MSSFFKKIDSLYSKYNDAVYKYLLFLYRLKGIKKVSYCLFLGALAAFALPPFNLFFLLCFAFPSIIRLTDFCETKAQAFWAGFCFCLGFAFVGLYWISFAALESPDYLWLFPLTLFGVPLVFAILHAFIFPIYLATIPHASAIKKIFLFTAIWILFEFLRLHVLQFPWNFIGYTFSFSDSMIQTTAAFGILGLSFFTVLWASSFHLLMLTGDKDHFIKYFQFFLFSNVLLVLFWIFGYSTIVNSPIEETDVKFRIVQGNVPINMTNLKYNDVDPNLEKYISLTTSKDFKNVQYIIWPEGAFDVLAFDDLAIKKRLSNLLMPGQFLITGSTRMERNDKGTFDHFNSMIMINSENVASAYDKTYLVPFGEFVPFRSLLPFVNILNQWHDFKRGPGMKTMSISPSIPPFGALICYEAAFTGRIKDKTLKPSWFLNITNDAWYGFSSGPFQHLQISRIRSAEEGVPMVRVSNNGISAVYDSLGRLIVKTALFKEAILDVNLPKPRSSETIFSILGNIPLITSILLFLIFTILELIYIKHDKILNLIGYKIATRKY